MQTFVLKKFSLLMGFPYRMVLMGVFWMVGSAFNPPVRHLSAPMYRVSHPFFVSVTEFNHNPRENILEISCKMFADDFENALKAQSRIALDISNPRDSVQLNKFASGYLVKHLQLKINNKAVALQFIGMEKENEAIWCYLQVNNVTGVTRLDISNSLLYDMYKDQISIMHASVKGNRKSTRLVYPDAQASFEW
jgi:hypothetical protein